MNTTDRIAKPKRNMEDLRKSHAKAFMRWSEEEDRQLLESYAKYRQVLSPDFKEYLNVTSATFGRKPNAIRGRLAKYFPDIAGWDYDIDVKRKEARERQKEEKKVVADEWKAKIEPEPLPVLDISGNPEAQEALRIMAETSQNLFLTGEAGTGKSTLLQYFRKTTKKNVVVLAPTGVAALNVEGQTIHSFCSFGPDITSQKVKKLNPSSPKFKLLEKLQTIVIDEISMVRADLLDCVDKFLRINGPVPGLPFGGIQMIFIGDLYQLPPVDKDFAQGGGLFSEYKSPYFFDSHVFVNANFKFLELKTMYRQTDPVFINILNAIRNNVATEEHLGVLNRRTLDEDDNFSFEKFAIYLTPTNARARRVNSFFLESLSSELKTFQGFASGNFQDRETPTELELQVRVGAQVMMLNNDKQKRWVNGTMGKIVEIKSVANIEEEPKDAWDEFADESPASDVIIVELETGETVEVLPHTWEMFQFYLDKYTQSVDSKTTGTFTQYPFKLAWAVTIHKAQGKTFDKVYVDLSSGTFAHGQLYVALSRCRTLEGINLKRPVVAQDIILDPRVINFAKDYALAKSAE